MATNFDFNQQHTLNERSINDKKRELNRTINAFKNKFNFGYIKSFGIISAENPDSIQADHATNKKNMKLLANALKDAHYTFVRQKGHFAGNNEYSYVIMNISFNVLAHYAGQFEQTSFFYCSPTVEGKIRSQYYEKQDTNAPYHPTKNPYILIETSDDIVDASDAENYSELGGKFRYTIPLKYFEEFSKTVDSNLKLFESIRQSTAIDDSINKVGTFPWYIRQKLYKGLEFFCDNDLND